MFLNPLLCGSSESDSESGICHNVSMIPHAGTHDRSVADEEAPPLIGMSSELHKRESESFVSEEEREWLLRRQEQPGWRVDHGEVLRCSELSMHWTPCSFKSSPGAGVYQEDREKNRRSYLVETGR